MQAYCVEVCQTEHHALGLSLVISWAKLCIVHAHCILLHNPLIMKISLTECTLILGKHGMGFGSYCWSSSWRLPFHRYHQFIERKEEKNIPLSYCSLLFFHSLWRNILKYFLKILFRQVTRPKCNIYSPLQMLGISDVPFRLS